MAAAKKPAVPAGKKVEREDDLRWWCPHCDHSNTLLTGTCGGCGSQRSGDTVKAPG